MGKNKKGKKRFLNFKKRSLVVISLISVLFLTGCWDAYELEELFFTQGIGLDVSETEPENILLTCNANVIEEGAEESVITFSSEGYSVQDAIANMQSKTYRKVVFGQARVLVISKTLAQRGLQGILDPFIRNSDVRRNLNLFVSEPRAQEILQTRLPQQPMVSVFLEQMLIRNNEESRVIKLNFRQFLEFFRRPGIDPVVPYLRLSRDRKEFILNNLALFKGDKFVTTLSEEESIMLVILLGQMVDGTLTVGKAGTHRGAYAFDVLSADSELHFAREGDKLKAHYHIKISGSLVEVTSDIKSNTPEEIKKIEEIIEGKGKEEFANLISKLQSWMVDPLGIGERIRVLYPDIFQKNLIREYVANLPFTVDLDITIEDVGITQ